MNNYNEQYIIIGMSPHKLNIIVLMNTTAELIYSVGNHRSPTRQRRVEISGGE